MNVDEVIDRLLFYSLCLVLWSSKSIKSTSYWSQVLGTEALCLCLSHTSIGGNFGVRLERVWVCVVSLFRSNGAYGVLPPSFGVHTLSCIIGSILLRYFIMVHYMLQNVGLAIPICSKFPDTRQPQHTPRHTHTRPTLLYTRLGLVSYWSYHPHLQHQLRTDLHNNCTRRRGNCTQDRRSYDADECDVLQSYSIQTRYSRMQRAYIINNFTVLY